MNLTVKTSWAPGTAPADIVAKMYAAGRTLVNEHAAFVLQQAQVIVPILSGALYESGGTSEEDSAAGPCAYVNFTSDHAGYVEFGTWKMQAQPYLRPALDASKQLFLDSATKAMAQVFA